MSDNSPEIFQSHQLEALNALKTGIKKKYHHK